MGSKTERGKVGFWFLIGLLAASGVAMAFIVVFGMFDSIAYSLVWRVFVADLYLIASLAAQHVWLRRAAWIGTGVTFLLGVVAAFWSYTPYDEWAGGRSSYTVGDSSTGWSPWFGFERDLEAAAHVMLIGVIVLGFVSLAYRWIKNERMLRGIYQFTFGAGLASVILAALMILDSPFRLNLDDGLRQLQAGLLILTLTAAAIVTIAAFVQRKAARSGALDQKMQPMEGGPELSLASQLASQVGSQAATLSDDELRLLVRSYVDEYLREREGDQSAS